MGVNDEDGIRQALHGLDTAQVLLQIENFLLLGGDFLLGKQIEGAVLLHLVQGVQPVDRALDGLEVGHHAARPPDVDVVHTATLRLFADRLGSLLLGADEQQGAAVCGQVTHEVVRFHKLLDGLLQVDDVDAVSLREDVLLHLGVPASGVVSEMDAGFQQLLDGYDRHFMSSFGFSTTGAQAYRSRQHLPEHRASRLPLCA